LRAETEPKGNGFIAKEKTPASIIAVTPGTHLNPLLRRFERRRAGRPNHEFALRAAARPNTQQSGLCVQIVSKDGDANRGFRLDDYEQSLEHLKMALQYESQLE
jgi:hypothetical protein